MAMPLLTTKLYIPSPRPESVPRPRLIERLNAGLHRKLTLISAPAGFGKTTLLSEWISHRGAVTVPVFAPLRVAWLSLDEGDNDPTRFLAYFVAAMQTVYPNIGETALIALQSHQSPPIETLLTSSINEISEISDPLVLVLDDFHVIVAPQVNDAIVFLLDNLPPQMHLVLSSRTDPSWPLARLRARGEMTELRADDLRFMPEEVVAFLNQAVGLDLSPEDVAALEDRTEGWIAGLQMASLAIQAHVSQARLSARGRKDISAFIKAFTGSHRFILDYLVEEVLEQQPHDVQEFLLKTSILERMTAALCDVVTDGDDSQTVLTRLEQANLFLVPLDDERRWYRYHHLFADLLKSTLGQRRSAEQIRELYRRASRWHRDKGSLEEAMIYAMAAQDFEQAAAMIEENIVSMLSRSEVPVLLGWIEQLPEQLVRSRPWIDVYRANTLALTGRLDEVDTLLDDVEKRLEPGAPRAAELLGHIAAVRAYAANLRGDAARTIEMVTLTQTYLPEEHLTARGMAAYALADTYFADDDMDSASQALLDMLKGGEKTGQLMMVVTPLCELATIKTAQGWLHQAEELYDQAHQWMVERNGLDSRVRCAYEFGLADLLREWNQLDVAYEHATTGMEYRRRLGGYFVVGDLPFMRILQAQGDVEGALRVLRDAEQIVQTHYFRLATMIAFRTARVVQWLAVGDVEEARRWADECDGGSELEQIALARLRLAQGRADDAQRLLDRQRALAETGGRTGRLIEILGLRALALEAQGQPDEAEAALSQALSLARPEGYVRVFLDLGRPLHELLKRSAVQGTVTRAHSAAMARITGAYARDLLEAFHQERERQKSQAMETVSLPPALAETLIDHLTEREIQVPQLLAKGLSNKEIAGRLVVAPSTVKRHLKNIYGKLDVHSRTQAVARGQELELL